MHKMFFLSMLLTISPVVAANKDLYTGRYSHCIDQSGGSTFNMLNCIGEELASQDARLNEAFKTLSSQLMPDRKQALLTAQRLWIQYRDANCNFYDDPEGGTSARVAANECVLRETAERAHELEEMHMPN